MNYLEWAREYDQNALRVREVIEKKKERLKDKRSLTADQRKQLTDDLKHYRRIYGELTKIGDTLRSRAGGAVRET